MDASCASAAVGVVVVAVAVVGVAVVVVAVAVFCWCCCCWCCSFHDVCGFVVVFYVCANVVGISGALGTVAVGLFVVGVYLSGLNGW